MSPNTPEAAELTEQAERQHSIRSIVDRLTLVNAATYPRRETNTGPEPRYIMVRGNRLSFVNRSACTVVGCVYFLLFGMLVWLILEHLFGG